MTDRRNQRARWLPLRASVVELPDVHPDLAGFDVRLNPFGQVDMTISIDRLNAFLDREVADPKLKQWGFGDDDEESIG